MNKGGSVKKIKIKRGSGNVFLDIAAEHPERLMARAQVMGRIVEIIRERGLTQEGAAKVLRIPQSKVSCLINGKLSMFSLDYLFELLNALGRDVEIVIKPMGRRAKAAATRVF